MQAPVLVRPVRPLGMPEDTVLWYLSMIVGISIDAWEGVLMGMFQYVCGHNYGI